MIKWLYKQSTGELYKDGALIAIGYSGVLTNKNNPDREQVRGMGPIPRGIWRIGISTLSKGPLTIILHHVSGNVYGRDMRTFRVHGDKRNGISGFASAGCIIVNPHARLLMSKDIGSELEVVR